MNLDAYLPTVATWCVSFGLLLGGAGWDWLGEPIVELCFFRSSLAFFCGGCWLGDEVRFWPLGNN